MKKIIKILSLIYIMLAISSCTSMKKYCIDKKEVKSKNKYFYKDSYIKLNKIEPYLLSNNNCNGLFLFYYNNSFSSKLIVPVLIIDRTMFLYDSDKAKERMNYFKEKSKGNFSKESLGKIEERFLNGLIMQNTSTSY